MEEERAKVRVVRCPKCDKLLPELPNFSIYRCGGCSATLQAKKQVTTSEASSSGKSNGVFVSDASSDISPNVDSVNYVKDEKKLNWNEHPNSDSSLAVARSEHDDMPKEPDISLPMESGREGGREQKYRLKAPLDANSSVKAKEEAKMPLENANECSKFHPRQARRDEGPSTNANSTDFPDQDHAELLRKIDELRDQLRRSCEVAEKPKERTSANRTTAFSSNPHRRYNGRGNWFPEGSSSLNRPLARISPFTNGHSTDIQNLYPAFHHGQYLQRPMNNYLYDPLVSYHHDGFYHQPACSCLHCYNGHWPNPYNNGRGQYQNNHGFYPVDGPSAFGPQSYNSQYPNVPSQSREPRARQQATIAKKPLAGAAPFISCYNCFELLQLPEEFSALGKSKHKLRCGSCARLISFEFDGRVLTLPPAAKNFKDDDTGRRVVDSYSVDFDEKLVLPSFPASSNDGMEKEYGFNLNESDVDSLDNSMDLPLEAEAISSVPSLPLREHFGCALSNQVIDGPGNGSWSRRSDHEKVLSVNGIFKQNSVKEIPVANEMVSPDNEYLDDSLCQDPWEERGDENQARTKNNKSGDSFFAGFIKKRFKESGKCKVSINGHPLSDRAVKKAEKLAGPVHPGDYWYDYRAGFWGVIGHGCLGIIPPFIEEFNYPLPKNCAAGNTDVVVNGRELHRRDLELLASRGLPVTEGCSYIIEISGKVWDEASGEELDSLGKLAPTIEKVKHGFGMRVPRLIL